MADPDFPDPTSLNKGQKLVRIIQRLQEGGMSSTEIMEDYDLDDRTLRRYLKDIKGLGLPLKADGWGKERRWSLDASFRRQKVPFTLLELVSLHFGRTLFDFMGGTQFAQDADDAIERVSTFAEQGDLVADLDRKFVAVREASKDHSRDSELIDEILTALLRQNPARALYARVDGPTRAYVLHPLTLGVYRQGLYLFALDVEEDRIKTFAVDRFRAFHRERKERFDYPPDYRPQQVVEDAFGILGGPVSTVCLRFRRASAPYIRERRWHHSQTVEDMADGGLRLRMTVGRSYELISWILSFGPEVRVESPEDLALHIRSLHQQAASGAT